MRPKSKVVAGLLAIFLGSLGIHKFYLGYSREGLIMLVITLVAGAFSVGLVALLVQTLGLVEGIIYLTRSHQDFDAIYVQGRKGWF